MAYARLRSAVQRIYQSILLSRKWTTRPRNRAAGPVTGNRPFFGQIVPPRTQVPLRFAAGAGRRRTQGGWW